MRTTSLLSAAGAGVLIGAVGADRLPRDPGDEAGIRRAVQYYFDGSRNADSATMRKGDTFARRVVLVDVAGTSAVAKLETATPAALVVDYMALLKIDGEWRVVNKIFDRLPRGATPAP